MTADQFDAYWSDRYPEATWLPHLFRRVYSDRWFRIHSLPDSKRYAQTDAEWITLLDRQNTLLTDLLGLGGEVVIVSGEYQLEGVDMTDYHAASNALTALSFTLTKQCVDLHPIEPSNYEPSTFYQSRFSEQTWQPHKFDELLQEIAEDQTRAFFISWGNACIVAPYNGGVDILLKDSATRDYYRKKYRAWLSARPDGL
jgi:hypothetical protein